MFVIFLVLTVLCWGMAPIFDKIALREVDAVTAVIFRSIIVAVILLAGTFIFKKQSALLSMSPKTLIVLTISAVLAGLLGMITYYAALKLGATSKVVPLVATYPLITAILSVVFLGENVTASRVVGIVLIVAGIWLVK